ncbi:hypothetical protein QWZ13_15185 [Reinekea marina]|nr:hypothetical protein [Reinekea marina]MDN3650260.1 hypothetical protein [Reinekea marina]
MSFLNHTVLLFGSVNGKIVQGLISMAQYFVFASFGACAGLYASVPLA